MKNILVLISGIIMFACSTQLMLPDEGEQVVKSTAAQKGQEVFMNYCNRCHPAGNAGQGPSIVNKPIPGFLIKAQVRNGFGAMPSFGKEHISKEDLDNIVAYIKEL